MKYVNPKIETLMQNGIRRAKRAGEYLLVASVALAPTIGLSGCSYFNEQKDNAVHAVQNNQQQTPEPMPEYSSPAPQPQSQETVTINQDLDPTPEFRVPEPIKFTKEIPNQSPTKDIQKNNSQTNKVVEYKGWKIVWEDVNGDGLTDIYFIDGKGGYHINPYQHVSSHGGGVLMSSVEIHPMGIYYIDGNEELVVYVTSYKEGGEVKEISQWGIFESEQYGPKFSSKEELIDFLNKH